MKHLVFNSYPRSGNVYLSHIASSILGIDVTAVHLPQIYVVKDIYQVAIFRNPVDAIASLLYKRSAGSLENMLRPEVIDDQIKSEVQEYLLYVESVVKNLDHLHIVDFNNLKDNPLKEVIDISNKFNIDPINGLSISQLTSDHVQVERSELWSEDHDGHLPRPKSGGRIKIEEIVLQHPLLNRATLGYNSLMETL